MAQSVSTRRKLWDNLGTLVLALVLAVVVWVNAVYQNDQPREGLFTESIPIEILNEPTQLAKRNTPERTVGVRIKAFSSSWDSLTAKNFRATIDLGGLGEGVHSVPVKVTCADRTVTILATQPENVYVELERLDKRAVEVTVDIVDEDDIPLGYAYDPPEIEPQFVRVEGPLSVVGRVAAVVAPLTVGGERSPFERTVQVYAADVEGNTVREVTLTPSSVDIHLAIEKRQNYREVTVRSRIVGQPARGYFVSSVEITPVNLTVVGPPAVIAEMPALVSTKEGVDVSGATRLVAKRLELDLPEGVSVLKESDESQTVLVTAQIDPVMSGTTVELPLQARRVGEGLLVKLSISTVDVILTGPAVLLDELQLDLLDAYVDASGLGAGTYQLKPIVDVLVARRAELADLIVTNISPAFVEIQLSPAPTPTPIPTATPTVTPTPLELTPTPTVPVTTTATITGTLVTTLAPPTPTPTAEAAG